MTPDAITRQDIRDIMTFLQKIQDDVGKIEVHIAKHHEKFKFLHDKVNVLDVKVEGAIVDLLDTKREVSNFRVWILSSVIAGLLSLVGAMVGVIRWLLEKV